MSWKQQALRNGLVFTRWTTTWKVHISRNLRKKRTQWRHSRSQSRRRRILTAKTQIRVLTYSLKKVRSRRQSLRASKFLSSRTSSRNTSQSLKHPSTSLLMAREATILSSPRCISTSRTGDPPPTCKLSRSNKSRSLLYKRVRKI